MNHSLNQKGQRILQKHVGKTKEVLNARGRVGHTSIPISSHPDVQKLAKLAKFGKIAGPGFIVLDGALRTHKVANMYQENNAQWKREAVIQAGGFAAGILAGAGIIFLIGIAPVGIVVGLVAAGVMAIVADRLATNAITAGYERFHQ